LTKAVKCPPVIIADVYLAPASHPSRVPIIRDQLGEFWLEEALDIPFYRTGMPPLGERGSGSRSPALAGGLAALVAK